MSDSSEIVIVSNRLPVHRVRKGGTTTWERSPGGLVSALTPILRERPSTWIGWAGVSGPPPAPFEQDGIRNHAVKLSRDDVTNYYDGFSNRTLWPLYHDAIRPPEYRRRWWKPFVAVNERFAQAAADTAAKNGVVWVHDYHLQLVPAMLRAMRPDLRIGFFLHIPFPPQELFSQLPWRREILEGLQGADVVGFQTKLGAANFRQLCRRFSEVGGEGDELRIEGRRVRADAFPISIDVTQFEQLADSAAVRARTQQFRDRLGSKRRIILGVDRMDYTKGIENRLRAFREMLRSGAYQPSEVVFVQIGVPSRERVAEYKELRSAVEELTGQINGEFGEVGQAPVHYLHRSVPLEQLVAHYVAADVMMVTPLRDGMNLVAKEYVACRHDCSGVLLLSEFAGAANQLHSAMLVNPHDITGLKQALEQALAMEPAQQREHMSALRAVVRRDDVFAWARSFFEVLAS